VVVVAEGAAAGAALPPGLRPVTGDAEYSFARPAAAAPIGEPLRAGAPRGCGRIWFAHDADDARALVAALRDAGARRELCVAADQALARIAAGGAMPGVPAADALAPDVGGFAAADPASAARVDHRIERGGETLLESEGGARANGRTVSGRLVRGSERFTLPLTRAGMPLNREQLVIARCTAPSDRGALLRVELEDGGFSEDLGPWRLGDAQAPDSFALDLFRVPADLLAGRSRATFVFTLAEGRELASLAWRFFFEEEIDGTWLTELDLINEYGTAAPLDDRDGGGSLLALGNRLHLRGFALCGSARRSYALPSGYATLAFTAGAAPGATECAGALEIELDGSTAARLDSAALAGPPRELALPLRGARRLALAFAGTARSVIHVGSPRLLR